MSVRCLLRVASGVGVAVAAYALVGCGDPTTTEPRPADAVASGATIAAGTYATCALGTQGVAYCWGSNGLGTLGNPEVRTIAAQPVRVASDNHYVAISSSTLNGGFGDFTTCALTADGAADCWGSNTDGLLGQADPVACVDSSTTFRRDGLCNRRPTRVAPALRFRRLTVGKAHICGVTTDGTTQCWGRAAEGQLGTGSTQTTASPTPVSSGVEFTDVQAGEQFTCALARDGAAYCWGLNTYGQLGDGTTTRRTVPTRVLAPEPLTRLDVGSYHACGVGQSGATVCWGDGSFRRLGVDESMLALSPLRSRYAPTPIAVPASGARSIAAGVGGGCAIDASSALRCWGWNPYGQVGTTETGQCIGTELSAACLPAAVAPGMTFSEVSVGSIHACARRSDGAVYCWGSDFVGMLGVGATSGTSLTPVRVALP